MWPLGKNPNIKHKFYVWYSLIIAKQLMITQLFDIYQRKYLIDYCI